MTPLSAQESERGAREMLREILHVAQHMRWNDANLDVWLREILAYAASPSSGGAPTVGSPEKEACPRCGLVGDWRHDYAPGACAKCGYVAALPVSPEEQKAPFTADGQWSDEKLAAAALALRMAQRQGFARVCLKCWSGFNGTECPHCARATERAQGEGQ